MAVQQITAADVAGWNALDDIDAARRTVESAVETLPEPDTECEYCNWNRSS